MWLGPSPMELWVRKRRNVRLPDAPVEGAGGSRLGERVEVPGGTGVVRSTAGSLLWVRCDPGTTADVAAAGLCVRNSSRDTKRTNESGPGGCGGMGNNEHQTY